ncbi:MAG: NusG domain II-containing protein [Candidatus Aminicenantes bacterium]|nr:NusG domain II-containing protein [Candidatus Aminicenantes bacterium]
MDRRDFFKTMLATPLLTPLILASRKSKNDLELYLIAEEPQKLIPILLEEVQKYSLSDGHKFCFLNPHPQEKALKECLLGRGWAIAEEPAKASLALSFSHLQSKALPSFTLVKEGRIWDIRTRKLLSLWQEMNRIPSPSSCLTIASFKSRPTDFLTGKYVTVYNHGQQPETLSLGKTLTKSFQARGGRITVQVRDGKAWISDSPCRHKICLYSPPVSLAGERTICAPNNFLLTVERHRSIDTVIG